MIEKTELTGQNLLNSNQCEVGYILIETNAEEIE